MEAARKLRQKQFVLDGEAVVLGVDASQTSTRFTRASTIMSSQFCAFDILAEGGDDLHLP